MSFLLPPTLLEDLFGARGPDERQRVLLAGIEEALRSQSGSDSDDADDERFQLFALAAARVAALTEEETPPSCQRLLLLEPLALGVRLEAGAVARLLEVCRRGRRRRRGEEEEEGEEKEESLLLLLEGAAAAAAARLAPPPRPAAEEEEEEVEETHPSALVKWSTESGASVSFEARSWRRRKKTATATTEKKKKKKKSGEEDSSFALLRGAAATKRIVPGQEIARIPFESLIHARMLSSTDAGKAICSLGLPDDEALLAFTLLDAADEDSPRSPIWDSLLRRGHASSLRTALNATEEEIALLDERTPARPLAGRASEHAASAASAAAPLLSSLERAFGSRVRAELFPGVGSFSEGAYRWAMAVWYAYAIEVDIDGEKGGEEEGDGGEGEEQEGNGGGENEEEARREKKGEGTSTTVPCLAPPLFLLNHSPHPHCVSYRLEEGEEKDEDEKEEGGAKIKNRRFLVARACRSAEKGQQLFLSYGRLLSRSAAHSLCYYGFVVRGSADPDAALEVELMDALEEGRGGNAPEEEERGKATKTGLLPPPGLETRHFLRETGLLSPAVLFAAEEIARLAGGGERGEQGGRPLLSPGEVLRRSVASAREALAATAERAEGAIKDGDSSSSSPFALAILEYARSGVELADKVAAGAVGW